MPQQSKSREFSLALLSHLDILENGPCRLAAHTSAETTGAGGTVQSALPREVLAGVESLLIQKETQDKTTVRMQGI